MRVIIEKHNDRKIYRTTCWNCGSLIEYVLNDIEEDRNGKHVICPVCESFISHSEKYVYGEEE